MKPFFSALIIAAAFSHSALAEGNVNLEGEIGKYGYAQGVLMGNRLKPRLNQDKTDLEAFSQGLKDALTAKSKLTNEQIGKVLQQGPVHLRAAKEKKAKENATFLAANKKKDGVKSTASGLQYTILKSGPANGKSPKPSDTVAVHYKGTLVDGTKFDSSYDRGQPASFAVGRVIPGWTEILQLMKPGDKWLVVIPSKLGYGPRAVGTKITANSILLFDIELLSIK